MYLNLRFVNFSTEMVPFAIQKLSSKVEKFTAPDILSLGSDAREFVCYYCQR